MFERIPRRNADLVELLKAKGAFSSDRIKQVLLSVDRADFARVSPYCDSPQSIGYNATISAPYMHAQSLERLADVIKDESRILDIGCGSGYLTTCFAEMIGPSGKVIGIDHISELVALSERNIRKHHEEYLDSERIVLVTKDGRLGHAALGPYDAIHVGAAASKIPEELINQLARGGRMLIPVGTTEQQFLQIDKSENDKITSKNLYGVIYVPLTSKDHQLNSR
ncbi:unnamed protein product [Bursaphelenchus okinawaensis]|uniref:Protein-L-isoaspartate(D-aspartate) O-methyltransferase n=1 Tax=Bursaphelenchus okinawaensis TaxID=465554 RepID=A0A811K0M1_9BILA|nr:unnamed protein product [Bursaphelenchus okinawaensis]CAG9088220.1 unnamed protein product [Bursaphelenchus okinawaensis]